MVMPCKWRLSGKVAVPVGKVEEREGEREEDPGHRVYLGRAVRRTVFGSFSLSEAAVRL